MHRLKWLKRLDFEGTEKEKWNNLPEILRRNTREVKTGTLVGNE